MSMNNVTCNLAPLFFCVCVFLNDFCCSLKKKKIFGWNFTLKMMKAVLQAFPLNYLDLIKLLFIFILHEQY